VKFNDLNKRLDSQDTTIEEMRESIQKWNDLGVSSDVFSASPLLGICIGCIISKTNILGV